MNRKLNFLPLILLFLVNPLFSQKITYTVDATIDSTDNGSPVYLKTLNDAKSEIVTLDSTTVQNGKFSFTETVNKPKQIRFVQIDQVANSPFLFVPEEGNITLNVSNNFVRLGGTNENNKLQELLSTEQDLSSRLNHIVNKYNDKDDASLNQSEYIKESQPLINEIKKNRIDYITKNIESDLGEFMLLSSLEFLPADTILLLIKQTRPDFQNSKTGQDLVKYYEPELAKTSGTTFKDLELTSLDGQKTKLSDFVGKGKVVLIDFWASWCPPCIKEMPALVELYKKYKDKGFEIVGVSLDEKKESWANAVKRLDITWPQMSDLKGWNSPVVQSYAVYSIPLTVLVDKDGVVVGANLHGEELNSKLDELLK